MRRYLPHAVVATTFVMILPASAMWAIAPVGNPALLVVSVPLAMALSLAAASIGSAVWSRRPGSQDLVFADLMLWGYLRRLRAERRLADARRVLALDTAREGAGDRHPDGSVEALKHLSALLEARDAYTHRHSRRVTRHAERIARALHLSPAEVAKVRTAAAVHDVGKIHIPHEILDKPGRLTDEEFAVIRRHPGDGAAMLAGLGDAEITAMVRHHHERVDGGGYPDGLAGDEIPLGARIIAVADTFDAMTSSRPYRSAGVQKRALEVLSTEAGAQLDTEAVSAFRSYYSGRRSIAWTTLVATAPQRFVLWLENTSGAFVQAAPAVGAAALLAVPGGSLLSPASAPGRPGESRRAEEPRLVAAAADSVQVAARTSMSVPRTPSGSRPARRGDVRRPEARGTPNGARRPRFSTPVVPPAAGGAPGAAAPSPRAPSDSASSGGSQGAGASPGAGDGSGEPPTGPPKPVQPLPTDGVPLPVPVPQVELPRVEPPQVQVPPVNLPPVNLPGVEPRLP